MITAKEAHKMAEKYISPDEILKTIEKHIKTIANYGGYELVYNCNTDNKETVAAVVAELRKKDFNVTSVPNVSTIVIHW